MHGQPLHAAVDQVAGDGDRIGLRALTGDDGVQVGALDGRADVDIGDLGDRVAVQSAAGRPAIGTSTSTTRATRRALMKPIAVTASASSGTPTRCMADRRAQPAAGTAPAGPRRATGQHEQRGKQAHRQQAGPGQLIRPARTPQRRRQQADRHQHGRHSQQRRRPPCRPCLPPSRAAAAAEIAVQQDQQGKDDKDRSARHGSSGSVKKLSRLGWHGRSARVQE
jgi:hypothetical protein